MSIKKVFDGEIDEEVHADFLKFGRGNYSDKFLLEGKKQAKKWAVKTGPEYVNFLVKRSLEKARGEVSVKGIIISTMDLKDEVGFDIVKAGNFQGIRKLTINTTAETSAILDLMEKYPRAFFALSFSGEDFVLKVKAKAPKSGKPGKDTGEGPKADFCTLKTTDKSLVEELFFRIGEFSECKISHTIEIKDVIYPSSMDSLKPTEIREQSKKKGTVIRKAIVDGEEKISEADFVA